MKFLLALLLPIVTNGAAIGVETRQVASSAGGGGSAFRGGAALLMPKKKALKVEQITPKFPGAKRIRLIYGPYILKAANSTVKVGNGNSMDKGGTGYQYMVDSDFPADVTVLDTISELQDENFKRADTKDGIYNHHNVFMDFAKPPAAAFSCATGKAPRQLPMSVFMAGATEVGGLSYTAAPGSNIKTGYYLGKDRKVLNIIDVVNYNNVERSVYVSGEIEYLPGKVEGYIDTRQERVDPGLCGGPNGAAIHPPKGQSKFMVNSTGIVAARNGYIVNMRGHVHDGGVNIVFKVNDKEICNSVAKYGGEGHVGKSSDGKVWETIAETSICSNPIKISKGDKLYMEAHYDLDLHPSREQGGHSGMGGMKRFPDVMADGGEGAEQMALVVTNFAYTD